MEEDTYVQKCTITTKYEQFIRRSCGQALGVLSVVLILYCLLNDKTGLFRLWIFFPAGASFTLVRMANRGM